jgi:hypothetical protein
MEARNWVGIGLSYRPARLHRLAESIPYNRFLRSIPGLLKSFKIRAQETAFIAKRQRKKRWRNWRPGGIRRRETGEKERKTDEQEEKRKEKLRKKRRKEKLWRQKKREGELMKRKLRGRENLMERKERRKEKLYDWKTWKEERRNCTIEIYGKRGAEIAWLRDMGRGKRNIERLRDKESEKQKLHDWEIRKARSRNCMSER